MDNTLVLVDMNGNLKHTWEGKLVGFRPLPDGEVLSYIGDWKGGQQDAFCIRQYSFTGQVQWEFRKWQQVDAIAGEPEENGKTWIARGHHDMQRHGVPGYYTEGVTATPAGGNTLVLSHVNARDNRINPDVQLLSDAFYEVDPQGKVVWQWLSHEHVDQMGFDKAAFKAMQSYPPADNPVAGRHKAKGRPGTGYDWMHINALSYLGPNKWYDQGDARFHPDNVIFNSRDANLFAIVDRKSGDIVWRIGPDYGPGSPYSKIGQIVGAHAVHIIPRGLPGEGNVLVFDNGGLGGYGAPNPAVPITGFHNARRDYSRVLEINPITYEIVWEYSYYKANPEKMLGHMGYRFFSPFVSYAQRLPNGNTLITEGDGNRVFEVTAGYEMVWEYINPYTLSSTKTDLTYRAYRVPYNWVPQLDRPREVAVTPPHNAQLHLPNDAGEMPDIGINQETMPVKAAPADDGPSGMHSY
ncbi:MAG: aryl-sulfate sulfotransferase [Desulfopila sp.]